MAKKNFSTKKMVTKGLVKAPVVKTNNGPGGFQRANFIKIRKNPIVGGPAKLNEHGKGGPPVTRK